MVKSKFQFTNPVLKRLEFVIHDAFVQTDALSIDIKIKRDIRDIENSNTDTGGTALVSVTICIGAKDDSTPFYIEAVEEAKFRWDKQAIDHEQAQILLKQNAAALLISYLRPVIAGVTAASPYPAYNLPYINLTAEE